MKLNRTLIFFCLLLTSCAPTNHNSTRSPALLTDFFEISETCPRTCFMGINPGVTTLEDVTPLLTKSDQFSYPLFRKEEHDFLTKWFFSSSTQDFASVIIAINPKDNLVRSIRVISISHYSIKDFVDLLGEPDEISITLEEPADARYIAYALYYTKANIVLYPRSVGFTGPKPDDMADTLYINMPLDDEHVPFWIIDYYNNRQPWLGYGHLDEYLPGVEIPSGL